MFLNIAGREKLFLNNVNNGDVFANSTVSTFDAAQRDGANDYEKCKQITPLSDIVCVCGSTKKRR